MREVIEIVTHLEDAITANDLQEFIDLHRRTLAQIMSHRLSEIASMHRIEVTGPPSFTMLEQTPQDSVRNVIRFQMEQHYRLIIERPQPSPPPRVPDEMVFSAYNRIMHSLGRPLDVEESGDIDSQDHRTVAETLAAIDDTLEEAEAWERNWQADAMRWSHDPPKPHEPRPLRD